MNVACHIAFDVINYAESGWDYGVFGTEGVIDSIAEFTKYIEEHGQIADGFRKDIDDNKQAIADHEAEATQTYETKTDAAAKLEEAKDYADEVAAPLIEKLAGIEENAQKNKVETVSAEFELTDRHLTVKEIAQDKITGLPDALAGKVDKQEGYRLMSEQEAQKIEKLVMDEDGSVSISGTVAAGNVDGLAQWITDRASTLEGLTENNFTDALLEKLNGIEAGAQKNKIEGTSNEFTISADGKILSINIVPMEKVEGLPEALAAAGKVDGIKVNGTLLEATEKIVEINTSDLVKASAEVTVAEDGTLGIGEINVNKLVQDEGSFLILNGGNASN